MKSLRSKTAVYALIICLAAAFLAGCGAGNSEVVASVNGEKITKNELYELMVKQNGQQTLDLMITQKIIELEAEKQNIEVTDKDIQKEMEKYYEYYGGKDQFLAALEASGFSLGDIEEDSALTVKVNKLLEPQISITDEEIKKYFEENKDMFAQEKQVKASHILVETEEAAQEVVEKIADGEDFAELAKKYSTDAMTKENGGDLGFFTSGQMTEEFEEAAFAMKVGEISAPVKTEYGYHIIKVAEVKEAQEATFEGSKTEVRDILFAQKSQEKYDSWILELRQEYKIENFLAVG